MRSYQGVIILFPLTASMRVRLEIADELNWFLLNITYMDLDSRNPSQLSSNILSELIFLKKNSPININTCALPKKY